MSQGEGYVFYNYIITSNNNGGSCKVGIARVSLNSYTDLKCEAFTF